MLAKLSHDFALSELMSVTSRDCLDIMCAPITGLPSLDTGMHVPAHWVSTSISPTYIFDPLQKVYDQHSEGGVKVLLIITN